MADEQDFKVFISWSGALAKAVAHALRDWLPTMFDRIDPWFSDTDIPAGATWFGEIQGRLIGSHYGIVVVTVANWKRPWLNFEAGSLSKQLNEDKNRVTPVLVNFQDMTQLTGHPLEQYNAVMLNEDGMWRLCESIALSADRNVAHVQQRFAQMWASLELQIKAAKAATDEDQPPAPEVSEPQRLDALTTAVRSLEATVTQLARTNAAYFIPSERTRLISFSNDEKAAIMNSIREITSRYRPIKRVIFKENNLGQTTAHMTLGGKALRAAEMKELVNDLSDLPVPVMITPNPPLDVAPNSA